MQTTQAAESFKFKYWKEPSIWIMNAYANCTNVKLPKKLSDYLESNNAFYFTRILRHDEHANKQY